MPQLAEQPDVLREVGDHVAQAAGRLPFGTRAFDDGEFQVIENVVVFVEHKRTAKDGRELDFDYENLRLLAASCNRRIVERGDYAAVCIGHTVDPKLVYAGQAKNPGVVGFAGPFKIGLIGPTERRQWCILATFRIYRDLWPTVRQYPRRSPELWLMPSYDQMFLDPIALLGAETPCLDMGLLYSATLRPGVEVQKYSLTADPPGVEFYSGPAVAPSAGNVFVASERYEGQAMGSTDEIVQAMVAALDSLDWVQWVKSEMQAKTSPAANASAPPPDAIAPPPPPAPAPEPAPTSPAPTASPAEPPKAEPPKAPPAAAPTAPAADRNGVPKEKGMAVPRTSYAPEAAEEPELQVNEPPAGALVPDDDEDDEDDLEPVQGETVEQYRARSRDHRRKRRTRRISYTAGGEILTRLAALEQQTAAATLMVKNAERLGRLESLQRQGYVIDPAEVFQSLKYAATGGVSDEEFERTLDVLMKTGQRAPIDAPLPPVPQGTEVYSGTRPGAEAERSKLNDAQRQQALQIAEAKALRGEPADYVAILRDIQAGRSVS